LYDAVLLNSDIVLSSSFVSKSRSSKQSKGHLSLY